MLPQFQTDDQALSLMQNSWGSKLNPLLSNPITSGQLLTNVSLASGDTTINHKLGRKLQGWVLVRKRGSATVYDKQDSNQAPGLTLVLNSSAAVSVDIYVF